MCGFESFLFHLFSKASLSTSFSAAFIWCKLALERPPLILGPLLGA